MDEISGAEQGCYTEHGVSGYGVAVKISSTDAMDTAVVKNLSEDMMLSIARKCMDLGAKCIGHIKAHIRTSEGTIKADTIGTAHGAFSSGELASPVSDLYMAVNSIVQGIHQDSVKEATLSGIHETAEGRGLQVTKEKEHAYFDEFDFTTSKEKYRRQLEEQLAENEENGSTA